MKFHVWTGKPFYAICLIIGSTNLHRLLWLGGETWRDLHFVTYRQWFDGRFWLSDREWSLG